MSVYGFENQYVMFHIRTRTHAATRRNWEVQGLNRGAVMRNLRALNTRFSPFSCCAFFLALSSLPIIAGGFGGAVLLGVLHGLDLIDTIFTRSRSWRGGAVAMRQSARLRITQATFFIGSNRFRDSAASSGQLPAVARVAIALPFACRVTLSCSRAFCLLSFFFPFVVCPCFQTAECC